MRSIAYRTRSRRQGVSRRHPCSTRRRRRSTLSEPAPLRTAPARRPRSSAPTASSLLRARRGSRLFRSANKSRSRRRGSFHFPVPEKKRSDKASRARFGRREHQATDLRNDTTCLGMSNLVLLACYRRSASGNAEQQSSGPDSLVRGVGKCTVSEVQFMRDRHGHRQRDAALIAPHGPYSASTAAVDVAQAEAGRAAEPESGTLHQLIGVPFHVWLVAGRRCADRSRFEQRARGLLPRNKHGWRAATAETLFS